MPVTLEIPQVTPEWWLQISKTILTSFRSFYILPPGFSFPDAWFFSLNKLGHKNMQLDAILTMNIQRQLYSTFIAKITLSNVSFILHHYSSRSNTALFPKVTQLRLYSVPPTLDVFPPWTSGSLSLHHLSTSNSLVPFSWTMIALESHHCMSCWVIYSDLEYHILYVRQLELHHVQCIFSSCSTVL